MRILLLQNCEAERFGLYATALASLGATLRHHRASCEEPFPGLSGLDGVLVGGTPISAYHVDAHPFLQKEVDFLRIVTSHRDRSLGGSPDTSRPRR